MKICFLSYLAYHYFNAEQSDDVGGAELQMVNFATELAKDKDFRVSFIVGDFEQPEKEIIENITVYKGYKKQSFLGKFFPLKLLRNIDADIYIQRASGFETFITALFCRLRRKKFLYMIAHDAEVTNLQMIFPKKNLKNFLYRMFFRLGFRLSSAIISQSEFQQKKLLEKFQRNSFLRKSAHRIISHNVSAEEKSIILWVSRCAEWKQPEVFLRLAEVFPEEKFVMICKKSHHENYFQYIRSPAAKYPNVQFIEQVPFSEIKEYFKKAKVFINTSKHEGFPNTFVQAMMWQTPILSLAVNPDGMLEKEKTGLCADGGEKKLHHLLSRLLSDTKLWEAYSRNGPPAVKQHHDIEKIIEEDKKRLQCLIAPRKTLRVGFVSFYVYPYFRPTTEIQWGGAECQLALLAKQLAKHKDIEVSFITGDFGQPREEILENVHLYKFFRTLQRAKWLGVPWWYWHFCCLLKRINCDIYIQRASGFEAIMTALYCGLSGKKFAYMVANDQDVGLQKPSYFQKGILSFLRWKFFVQALKRAHIILVQHEKQKELLRKNYGKEGIIRKSGHIILPFSVEQKKDGILWVGKANHFVKQPEFFLRLAEAFPHEKFTMICPLSSNREYFENIQNQARAISNVAFVDSVLHEVIHTYYERAKVFINTSSTEGFPNTFLEAAMGKTPILSLQIDPDGILEKYKMGKAFHGNFEALKDFLEKFLADEQLRKQYGEKAYRYVVANHDIEKIVEQDIKWLLLLTNKTIPSHDE